MATIPTFKSSTLEGAFLEAAFLLQQGELNYYYSGDWKEFGEDYQLGNYINITIDTDQQRANITATIPIKIADNSFGGYLIASQFIENTYIIAKINLPNVFYFPSKTAE